LDYILDTNILLIFIRNKSKAIEIQKKYDLFNSVNNPIISVVSLGEIKSIALRNKWGSNKINRLNITLNRLIVTDINSDDVINRYAEIEAFSQGKLETRPLNTSARNMGKNDLWIAATVSVLNGYLITTDQDFNHLDQQYLELINIVV